MNDDTVFARLKIWACGKARLIPAEAFGSAIAHVVDRAFWDSYHQRDLLLVLADRWSELPCNTRKEIETRLLKGPLKWDNEEESEFQRRRAWMSLARIAWLADKGCNFNFNLSDEVQNLRTAAPDWKPDYARRATELMGPRGGWVRTEKEYSELLKEPLASTLSKARELGGRDDFLIERDPFAGLSDARPVRAFAALKIAGKRGEFPEWAWRTFLNAQTRKNDKPYFSALIAERIARYPQASVADFIRPVSDWLVGISKALAGEYPAAFSKLVAKLIHTLTAHPAAGSSGVVRSRREPDWTTEAINAPAGKIAEALFDDPRTDGMKAGVGLPPEWLRFASELLSLPDDLRRHALVIFAHNLDWFYRVDPNWTEANLLCALRSDEDDRGAFWSGFLWGSRVPNQELYKLLKPSLLTLAKEEESLSRRGYGSVLAGIILAGWGERHEQTNEQIISNDDLRDVLLHASDEFRSDILWQAETWSEAEANGESEKWTRRLIELLREVWPRQKSARTPTVSARLCDIALSNEERFGELIGAVMPLITAVDSGHLALHKLQAEDSIVDAYPAEILALLYAALPDDVAAWPYGIDAALNRIGEADSSLRMDERLLELKRKWDSR